MNNKQIDKLERKLKRVEGTFVPENKVCKKWKTLGKFKDYLNDCPLFFKKASFEDTTWIGARKVMLEVLRPDRKYLEILNEEDVEKAIKELNSIHIYTKFVQPLEDDVACWFQS